jgi:hypothetical protein
VGVRNYIDRVLEAYSTGPFYEEVVRARRDFNKRTGDIAEGSDKFELQMLGFLEWYLFDRPLEKSQLPPVKLFVVERLKEIPPDEQVLFEDLAQCNHSLFEVLKVKGDDVYVKDLFTGEKYVVEDPEINQGFNKGDIFEGRLIKFKDRLVFGLSFVFHPAEVRSFILKQIKLVKYLDDKKRLALLHKLALMKLKAEQYAHIDVQHIYAESPLL